MLNMTMENIKTHVNVLKEEKEKMKDSKKERKETQKR